MSFDEEVDLRARIWSDITAERKRQHEKWGEQNLPSVHDAYSLLGPSGFYEIPRAARAREKCEWAIEMERCTYAHIAIEELCEAVETAVDDGDAAARDELIQLAAVIVQWVECIDRRKAAK